MKLTKRHLALLQDIVDGHSPHYTQQVKTTDDLRDVGLIRLFDKGYDDDSQGHWEPGEEASRALANPQLDWPFVRGERSWKSLPAKRSASKAPEIKASAVKAPAPKKGPALAKKVPAILPREPLTKKALAAIHKYLHVRSGEHPMYTVLAVKYVLEAERMRRSSLYAWLEERGYKWHSKVGFWVGP